MQFWCAQRSLAICKAYKVLQCVRFSLALLARCALDFIVHISIPIEPVFLGFSCRRSVVRSWHLRVCAWKTQVFGHKTQRPCDEYHQSTNMKYFPACFAIVILFFGIVKLRVVLVVQKWIITTPNCVLLIFFLQFYFCRVCFFFVAGGVLFSVDVFGV